MNDQISPEIESTPAPRAKVKFNLICASKVKRYALEFAKANRAQKFSRVSEEFLIACESNLKQFIMGRIRTHPSKGKTLQ
jgi:hypothetical protein